MNERWPVMRQVWDSFHDVGHHLQPTKNLSFLTRLRDLMVFVLLMSALETVTRLL
jgi:hypothetical protein